MASVRAGGRAVVVGWMVSLSLACAAFASPPSGYTLSWSEEFDQAPGSAPNSARWGYDLGGGGWGNNELETYVNDLQHAQVVADTNATDGRALQIQATTDGNGHYTSARLLTKNKVSIQYGYVEGRIRLTYGQGIWPAFWMLGDNFLTAGWPGCGEIDIMENVGNELSAVHGTLHGPGYSGGNGLTGTYTLPGGQQFKNAYHTFAVRWRPDGVTFYVDDIPYETRTAADVPSGTTWAFNHGFFFILNVAVGGNWPGSPNTSTVFPQKMLVDYIRVYKFQPLVGSTVTLKSLANNKYVSADRAGAAPLIANHAWTGAWEQFQVVDAGSGNVALRSLANNLYVNAASATTSLVANQTPLTSSAMFQWVDAGSGNIALKSIGTGQYVSAENTGASPLIANRAVPKTWEMFAVGTVSPNHAGYFAEADAALGAAGGGLFLNAVDADRLDVENTGAPIPFVDVADAVRLTRRADGLDG